MLGDTLVGGCGNICGRISGVIPLRWDITLFDSMNSADEVKTWFAQHEGYFFQEWPRGRPPLSRAIADAQKCRFASELTAFLKDLDDYWHSPFRTPPWEKVTKLA